ncbi:Sodium/hydrogen exchanger family protein [compost metagenome]
MSLWLWLLLFIIGGSLGKILGSYISGRTSGLAPRESIELGILMNAKGLVELVVLEVGVKAGVLSETSYTVLLLFSLISTVLTPPSILLLNRYVRKNQGGCSSSQGAGI